MQILPLNASQIDAAVQLIWETFLQFEAPDYSDEGITSFQKFIQNEEIVRSLSFWGAYDGKELIGTVATRENHSHICCFFVRARYQRQGIGKMLWEHLLKHSESAIITVNSSPYAIAFYHRLGFVDTDSEQLVDGIRFTPMKFTRSENK